MNAARPQNPQQRRHLRIAAEHLAARCLVQLLCTVSILRTLLTRIVPMAGSSSWWLSLVCFMPGAAVYALLTLAMHAARQKTLTDLLRCCFGQAGAWAVTLLLAGLLLLDGTASITSLITMFTEGIGTRGTQTTMTLLTAGVLLVSLHREGLPRAVLLLRWLMLAGALLVVLSALQDVRTDGLFSLMGDGAPSIREAFRNGGSLAWPLILLLTIPEDRAAVRLRAPVPVLLMTAGVVLFLNLTIPHELLIQQHDLAGTLLQPTIWAAPAVRTLSQCLLMLSLFLAVAGAAQLATDHLCAPMGTPPMWLPHAVLLVLAASQALDISRLWRSIGLTEPWLLLPMAVLAALCVPIAWWRRKRG